MSCCSRIWDFMMSEFIKSVDLMIVGFMFFDYMML
jgi:hypothetical protein